MTVDVKVPVLAESVAEANLLQWHKAVGDTVKRGDNLIDIETDKVTLEVAAPNNGVLVEILKQNGEEVESDELIARIETENKASTTTSADADETEQPSATVVPLVSDSSTTEESKEEPEPQQQTLLDSEDTSEAAANETTSDSVQDETSDAPLKLSPAVRNLLSENDLQATDIKEHQHEDRITKEDVLNQLGKITGVANKQEETSAPVSKPSNTESSTQETQKTQKITTSSDSQQRPEERVPMTRLRKRVAERLLSAQHDNALLTTFNEVNMQPVIDLRSRYKQEFEETHQVKLGYMSFFTRAAVEALKKFPVINASVEDENILYRGYFDIGIAVSAPRGLVVPVLRDADTLSFASIESKIAGFGQKAKEGTLSIEELTGGTFTITNGGIFGSLLSTPIINPPQSAILGMHKIQERPVAENGQVVIRPMMYLALSYDHRIIDGREAVQFLVSIKEQIEDPSRLLLQI